MITALQPSYWQRTAAGLVVVLAILPVLAYALVFLVRAVLVPRAAGRRWPEGARVLRPVVEGVVDAQRRAIGDDDPRATVGQGVRFGLVVAACAVLPVSTGLVITQPGLGLYVFPLVVAFEAGVIALSADDRDDVGMVIITRVALAALLGLCAGTVAAQWGTARLSDVVAAQASGSIFGIAGWGLPTMWVQPAVCVVAVTAIHLIGVSVETSSAARRGGSLGLVAAVVDQALGLVAAAWLVCAFGGGGAVPWEIENDGVRQVVSVIVFSTKLVVVALGLAWARSTWPAPSLRLVRVVLVAGSVIAVASIGATVGIRHLV